MCHSSSSQFWVSPGMRRPAQDMLTPWLTHMRCQELQKAPDATSSWEASSLYLLLWPDLNVTAPASSNLPATTLDFVPVAAEPWRVGRATVAAGADGITDTGRRDGGVCLVGPWWCWKRRLTVTRVLPGQGDSCHGSGCLHVGAPAALGSRWDGLCEPPNGSCLHPGQT